MGVLKVSGIEVRFIRVKQKPLTGESKFRIGSSNVCDVNERFDTWSRKSLVKMEQKFETRIETRPEIFFFSLFSFPPPSFDSIRTMRVKPSSSVNTYHSFRSISPPCLELARKHSFSPFSVPVGSGTPRAVNFKPW